MVTDTEMKNNNEKKHGLESNIYYNKNDWYFCAFRYILRFSNIVCYWFWINRKVIVNCSCFRFINNQKVFFALVQRLFSNIQNISREFNNFLTLLLN